MFLVIAPILPVFACLIQSVNAKGGGGGGRGGGGRGGGRVKGVGGGGGGGATDPETIGIIIGSIVGALIIAFICWWLYRRHQRKKAAAKLAALTQPSTAPNDADLEAGKSQEDVSKVEVDVVEPVPEPKPAWPAWRAVLALVTSRNAHKDKDSNSNHLAIPQPHDNVALLGRRESSLSDIKVPHSPISRSSSPSGSSGYGGSSPARRSYEKMPELAYAPPSGPPPQYVSNRFSMPSPTIPAGAHLQMPSPGYP